MIDCDNCGMDMGTFARWKLINRAGLNIYELCSLSCVDEFIHNHLEKALKQSREYKVGK